MTAPIIGNMMDVALLLCFFLLFCLGVGGLISAVIEGFRYYRHRKRDEKIRLERRIYRRDRSFAQNLNDAISRGE